MDVRPATHADVPRLAHLIERGMIKDNRSMS
jgi:hypothetical protein